ncbi:hypothetical protein K443DRAFT_113559, partial [Laccaria amethystina LaAM-08-1]
SLLCHFKGKQRRKVCVPAFQRYCVFSVWWAGTLRAKRDERCVLLHSRDIPHFLVW